MDTPSSVVILSVSAPVGVFSPSAPQLPRYGHYSIMCEPKVDSNYFQERAGVNRVAALLNSMRLIWRETENADVGIDGQLELVDDENHATGYTVAVQIKSGSSYLRGSGSSWKYYPDNKHLTYWERYPLPVILMLHDPESDDIYWQDVRRQLRSDQHNEKYLSVPKAIKLYESNREQIFDSFGVSSEGLHSIDKALKELALNCNTNPFFNVSHLDFFINGISDIGLST